MIRLMEPGRLRLGVLASGRGSNFIALWEAIERQDLNAEIKILISDKADAPALEAATKRNIPAVFINPQEFTFRQEYEQALVGELMPFKIDLLVLAGYMRIIGSTLLGTYKNRVVNIHPALLPSFKGLHAQEQALVYGVKFSGCSVHLVDEGVDTGPIIKQAVVPVRQDDSVESLSRRILKEEHNIYWQSLQLLAQGQVYLSGRRIYIKDRNQEVGER